MNINWNKIGLCCYALILSLNSNAQNGSFDQKAQKYIQQYASWAVEEQRRVGIPASITLAQGIYETGAGESELAKNANNHFGIKCKKEWKGQSYAYTDDAPNECFRKYNSAKESYLDHSDYLKNSKRYAELWDYKVTNYHAWAHGLKKCGYATNPAYAKKLIKMIEDYNLQQFTLAALQTNDEIIPSVNNIVQDEVKNTNINSAATITTPLTQTTSNNQNDKNTIIDKGDGTFLINNIKAIKALKGQSLLETALKYNIRYERLLEINDLPDAPLSKDMYIFLSQKSLKGAHETHIVQEGESIETIAHNEGMSTKQLRVYNYLALNEQVPVGTTLYLQKMALLKPQTIVAKNINTNNSMTNNATATYKVNNPNTFAKEEDYIQTQKISSNAEAAKESEIEIGYGAERPKAIMNTQTSTTQTIPQTTPQAQNGTQQTTTTEISNTNIKEESSKNINTTPQKPKDEITLLKERLDRAVYGNTSSNIKVSNENVQEPSSTFNNNIQNSTTPQYHTVKKGETAYSIAQQYGIGVKQLNELNNLNFEAIKIGQKLRVK